MKFNQLISQFKSIILIILITAAVSQNTVAEPVDVIIGSKHEINSKILADIQHISVHLPESYGQSSQKYPVLFLLDGQRLFSYGVSLSKSFKNFEDTPEFIVVGIDIGESNRYSKIVVNDNLYLDFIEKELLSFIDDNFRTSNERIIFGWQYAGSLLIKALVERSNLFDGYLVASPFPVEGKRLDSVMKMKRDDMNSDEFFFLRISQHEGVVEQGTDKLDKEIMEKAFEKLNWSYKKLAGEDHNSTAYTTIHHGVRKYFSHYKVLQFNNTEVFKQAGGMKYVVDYYQKRAKRYGFSPEILTWTKFSLVRDAIREDDLKQVDKFIERFGDTLFSDLSANRINTIAGFYLDNRRFKQALNIYKKGVGIHPESAGLANGLGHASANLNDKSQAIKYFELAIGFAKKSNSQRLAQYEQDLLDIKK